MKKINKEKTERLLEKRQKLTKSKDSVFTIQDEKKVFQEYGKGDESNSRYFRHVVEELERRGL